MDRERYDDVYVMIINESSYTLAFSNINNGGDARFYPHSSFTLPSGETYQQEQHGIGSYDPIVIAPVSMTLECNDRSIDISGESQIERNPCISNNWRHYSNRHKYGPGVFFDFIISDTDIDNWFGLPQ